MTKWLSHRMVERGIIKEEEQELYQFGIRNGMILLLNVVTALVIGLLTEQLAVVAVFTLSFMVLRSYTGGYHSDSRIFCYLGSNLVLLVPVYTQAVFYKTSLAWLLAVLLVSAGIIFLLSPMHSKNRKLDKEEQKHFGRKARLIAVNLSPQHRGRDTKLLVLLKKLLHRYQKNLLYMESVLLVVVTT